MNIRKYIFIMITAFVCTSAAAKTAEFFENVYIAPASEQLVEQGQKVAELIGYEKALEMASPKKAGIEVNPLNKFIWGQTNPQTQNALIIANPEWLSLMPEEQQTFLIARALTMIQEGNSSWPMKAVHYAYIVLSLFLVIALFFVLRRTVLKNHKAWISVVGAFVITVILELVCFDPLERILLQYFGRQRDRTINELVVQKTGNRDAAIKALEFYDVSIEEEYPKEPKFWTPLKGIFKGYAETLKKNN